ncbi:MAG: hypothetical protein OXH76_22945 [Boseongicola sp.]|nr:hypothetical protein [Boseongicola sp.]
MEERYDRNWFRLCEHAARHESGLILAYAVIVGIAVAVLGVICFSDFSSFFIRAS